ncbi:hypothetical protein NEFER03_0020 [Nematocida sp. LUAm3]|nr:hypothetical protein NEFER03_0020 [Nematocida sp. LUAm3]KAI5173503.1 hypothetical protein NEFER02_0019 [Nematocida sp. LUAm2]KAI5176695.1 hypothetical protein NEFER01_0020 [Nematocida sp. LUAm1]
MEKENPQKKELSITIKIPKSLVSSSCSIGKYKDGSFFFKSNGAIYPITLIEHDQMKYLVQKDGTPVRKIVYKGVISRQVLSSK